MRTIIVSDIHLGSRHSNTERLGEVLATERFDRLILNGDTLNNVNLKKLKGHHWALLNRLRQIGKERELILIRGNHDHGWDHQFGPPNGKLSTVHVLPALLEVPMHENYSLELQGRPYLVLHGDRFDPTLNYPLLTDVAIFCYQMTTQVNKKLAKWLKKKSKKFGGLLETIRARSVEFARAEKLHGVILGHTHYAEDVIFNDVHYLNTGSWTESPSAYITIEHGRAELHTVAT